MFVTYNRIHNILEYQLCGVIDQSAMQTVLDEMQAVSHQLTPGFRVLTDLTSVQEITPDAVPLLEQLMKISNELGVKAVVRIIPDPSKDVGLAILSIFHYGQHVPIKTCRSRQEAQQLLGLSPESD